jgi:hypothetical protein
MNKGSTGDFENAANGFAASSKMAGNPHKQRAASLFRLLRGG